MMLVRKGIWPFRTWRIYDNAGVLVLKTRNYDVAFRAYQSFKLIGVGRFAWSRERDQRA